MILYAFYILNLCIFRNYAQVLKCVQILETFDVSTGKKKLAKCIKILRKNSEKRFMNNNKNSKLQYSVE